jgi:hypothetical protein
MNKTIKTFLVLSFITATCWAYLLGEYIGTGLSAGFHSVSSITGGGGWSPGHAPSGGSSSSGSSTSSSSSSGSIDTSKIDTSGGAVDVSSIDLGFFSGGSSGDITAQSNSGTSGGTVDRTKSIDVSAYAKAYDGDIDKMIAAIKNDFSRTPTAGEYQAAAQKINSENKLSALTQADVDDLIAKYRDNFEELMADNLTFEQIMKISNNIVKGISEKFDVSLNEAKAILVEVNNIMIEKEVPGSLFERLDGLSINDPILVEAKDKMLLQKAIAEAMPETSETPYTDALRRQYGISDEDWNIINAERFRVESSVTTSLEEDAIFAGAIEKSIEAGDIGGGVLCPIKREFITEAKSEIYNTGIGEISIIDNENETSGTPYTDALRRQNGIDDITWAIINAERFRVESSVTTSLEEDAIFADAIRRSIGAGDIGGGVLCPIKHEFITKAKQGVLGGNYDNGYGTEEILNERVQKLEQEIIKESSINISEEMMIMALGLAIVDKGLIITDENVKEVISSIALNEVEYYISMINKVAKEYSLTPSETVSVLKAHIADQRASNPNYKLSEENDIIGSIEANKNTSRLLEIIQETKEKGISAIDVDLNRDGEINLIDSAILMSFWGENSSGQNSDINKDGNTNLTDYSIMMSYWNYAFK